MTRSQKLRFSDVTTEQWKIVFALGATFTSRFFLVTLLDPLFPPEGRRKGVSISLNGIILSMGSLVTLLASAGMGMLVTWVGPRKMLMIGTTLNSLSMCAFGMLQFIESTVAFSASSFVLLGLSALGTLMEQISVITLGAKTFPDNLGLVIGTTELCVAVGESVSLLTSGFIYDAGGFYLPFLVFSFIHGLCVPVCYFLIPERNGDTRATGCEKTGGSVAIKPWRLLKIPRTMLIATLIPIQGACWGFQGANLEEHLTHLSLTTTQVNLMFLLTSGVYAVLCLPVGWTVDKIERKWLPISFGLAGAGIGMVFLGPLTIFGLPSTVAQKAIVLTIVTALMPVCILPAFQAVIQYTIDAGYPKDVATYAVAQSLLSTTDPIGGFAGTFGGGFLVEYLGFPVASAIVGASMVLAGGIIASFFICCDKPQLKQSIDTEMETMPSNIDGNIKE